MSILSKLFVRNGNKIILHKKNGKICEVAFLIGLDIKFRGKNSTVEIWEPYKFVKKFGSKKSKIYIDGDDNYIRIKNTKHSIYSLRILGLNNNNKVFIGENFFSTGNLQVEFAKCSDLSLSIGDNCMFGQGVNIMLDDFHKIMDLTSGEQINKPKKGIFIGNNVWLARDVRVLKDVSIADNTVVATGSIVTKSSFDNNVILAGIPAKVVKNNITWGI